MRSPSDIIRDFSSPFVGPNFGPIPNAKNDQYFPQKMVKNSKSEIRNQEVQILALELCHFVNPVTLR